MPYLSLKQNSVIHFCLFFVILLLLHIYVLFSLKLFDYDSIHNFQILEEIHKGDWHNLFHHSSPIFYLFYSFFFLFFKNIHNLLFINILLSIFAIYFFTKSIKNSFWLGGYWIAFSLFISTCSHYFSIESLSLLSMGVLWYRIHIFLQNKALKNLFSSAFIIGVWCAICMLINYKFIVVLPFLVFSSWTIKKDIGLIKTLYFKVIYYTLLGFILPIIFLMLLGWILGLHWYQYPATLYSIFSMSGNSNPTAMQWGYYFSYFLNFENILIGILLLGRLLSLQIIPFRIIEKVISIVCVGVFIVMSFLPKAPRGLIFILPLIYLWAFNFFEILKEKFLTSRLRKRLGVSLLLGSLLVQVYRIQENLYPYKQTSYLQVAQYLKEQNTKVVFTTLGMGIYPYLDKSIKMEVLREIADTVKFEQFTGKKYLLYDVFCETAGHQSLYSLKQKKAILRYPEKSLLAPTLFLEHSEYTGLSFEESLELQKHMQKESFQLLLIPLP
ncbi:hypothetical protein AD998_06990 [bacterium 336/3]|nr:hypothetical protein AD998_06990 [bacterium 336/3]